LRAPVGEERPSAGRRRGRRLGRRRGRRRGLSAGFPSSAGVGFVCSGVFLYRLPVSLTPRPPMAGPIGMVYFRLLIVVAATLGAGRGAESTAGSGFVIELPGYNLALLLGKPLRWAAPLYTALPRPCPSNPVGGVLRSASALLFAGLSDHLPPARRRGRAGVRRFPRPRQFEHCRP